jgi:hypothetical protein
VAGHLLLHRGRSFGAPNLEFSGVTFQLQVAGKKMKKNTFIAFISHSLSIKDDFVHIKPGYPFHSKYQKPR